MNIKKIIPLSFAALSVAGALCACSDTAVVGADVQGNSVALSSSSVTEPGSSNSISIKNFSSLERATVLALVRANSGTAKTLYHVAGDPLHRIENTLHNYDFPIDSINAHETFNNAVQSIYNGGGVIRLVDKDPVYQNIPYCEIEGYFSMNEEAQIKAWFENEACVARTEYEANYMQNKETYVIMKDEEGLFHGPIISEYGYLGEPERAHTVICYSNDFVYHVEFGPSDYNDYYKWLRTDNLAMIEDFKKDCASEHGEIEDMGLDAFGGIYCSFKYTLTPDSIVTYQDPYWEKYAKHIVESCVTAISDYDEYLEN